MTADDGAEIDKDTVFAALCDQTLIGFLKFNGPNEKPDTEMGLLYGGYQMPARESLGDLDQSQWEIGLNGEPEDPYQHHVYSGVAECRDARALYFRHELEHRTARLRQSAQALRPPGPEPTPARCRWCG